MCWKSYGNEIDYSYVRTREEVFSCSKFFKYYQMRAITCSFHVYNIFLLCYQMNAITFSFNVYNSDANKFLSVQKIDIFEIQIVFGNSARHEALGWALQHAK